MPKKKPRNFTEMESDALDNASVVSIASDGSDIALNIAELDDDASILTLMDKLCSAVDSFGEKRPETRIKSLKATLVYLRAAYLCLDSVTWNYASTCLSGIEFILKKGRTIDRALAAECLAVLCTQFDPLELPIWLEKFKSQLETIYRDASEPFSVRGPCTLALATIIFFANDSNYEAIKEIMQNIATMFRGSCPKGDGKTPILPPDVVSFHLQALQAWTLLYTVLPSFDAGTVGKAVLPTLMGLIQGSNVDIRIAAGESVAIVYERIRDEVDDRFRGAHFRELSALLEELSTDGTKSRSKEDRKRQRQSFREILSSVLHDEAPETTIKFGKENMMLSTCASHFYYNVLCDLLAGGINKHLRDNLILRALFDLGPPVPRLDSEGATGARGEKRSTKAQRNYANQFAFKMRTQHLNSRRDKRATLVPIDDQKS